MKKLIIICLVTAMFIVGNNPSFADPVAITLKSDASTLAAALGPGAPPPDVLARLDTPDISGLVFQPVLVGSYGTYTPVPPSAPPDTAVVNIPPGDGENGYFMMTFQLTDVFDNIQLTGVANVDDFGRVFLNGHPLTAPIGSGVSESGNVAFGTSDPSLFQTGENTVLISVANTGSGPSGGAFFVNITSGEEGFKISGRVTDKATGLPLPNIHVNCWNNDLQVGADDYTDANGIYKLTNLPPGVVDVSVEPDSYYAYMGISELELEEDINNLDFALPAGAILSGRVLGVKTAKPLAGIEIEYSSEETSAYKNQFTDADGSFCLTQLPPGIAEVKAKPNVNRGCAWNLPWGSDLVCLNEGENRSGRIITLEKGAIVRGHIKDVNGNPLDSVGYDYSGRDCDGWDDTNDVDGSYQIRLPVGIYAITPDNTDEFGALPAMVTITDVNEEVNVPDMIVYTEENGGQISGEVNNPGGYAKTGYFIIISFKAGTAINDPNAWYTIRPVSTTGMGDAGPFSLSKLPPDVNYDIYLCVDNQANIESIAVRDSALNVAVGTTGINLVYSSQGSTVTGTLKNADDRPVLGATVLLSDSSGGFAGFGDADCNGGYVIYNAPAGTYTAAAVHSKYLPTSTTVEVVEGVPVDVNTIIMPFRGEKEGPDLNGDGNVDMVDVAEFAGQWLNSGASEADFNQDNRVNFSDWVRIAENWMSRAIWLHE